MIINKLKILKDLWEFMANSYEVDEVGNHYANYVRIIIFNHTQFPDYS